MTTTNDRNGAADALDSRIHLLLNKSPFAVLGYSAEDQVWCPSCLHQAAGLKPGLPDTNGRLVQTLYLVDTTTRDERCGHCDMPLVALHPRLQEPAPAVAAEPPSPAYKTTVTARPPVIRRRAI